MYLIIIGLLVLTFVFKLLGKTKQYKSLMTLLIIVVLWKSGLFILLLRVVAAVLFWLSAKMTYYGGRLFDYFSGFIFFF